MSATVLPFKGAQKADEASPLCPPPPTPSRAALTGAVRSLWVFARRWAEGLGWLVFVASIIAAVR